MYESTSSFHLDQFMCLSCFLVLDIVMHSPVVYLLASVFVVALCSPLVIKDEEEIRRRSDMLILKKLYEALPMNFKKREENLLPVGLPHDKKRTENFDGDKGCHHIGHDEGCHEILDDGTEIFIPAWDPSK